MAQSLASAGAGIGHNGDGVSRAVFLDYLARHEDADAAIEDAKETVRSLNRVKKDLRKAVKADGINLDAFDRAVANGNKSGEEREAEERQYRRYMEFQNKPVGFQAGLDFNSSDRGLAALNTLELDRIEAQGYQAGNAERPRTSNTYTPGTEAYQRWDAAWVLGDADRDNEALDTPPAPEKRGRGRPRKDKNGVAAPNDEAHQAGRSDALEGHRDHAARWPAGYPGHADYELGHQEGEQERHGRDNARILNGEISADQARAAAGFEPTPKRGRGRPKKQQPEETSAEA